MDIQEGNGLCILPQFPPGPLGEFVMIALDRKKDPQEPRKPCPFLIAGLLIFLGAVLLSGRQDVEEARRSLLKKMPVREGSIALGKLMSFPADDEAELLWNPVSISAGSDGEIYVVDRAEHCVYVCDDNGNGLRTIGRKGQGPGELLNPGKAVRDGNKILVLDRGNSRVVTFDISGRYLSSFKLLKYYRDMAAFHGSIYLTPMGQREGKLIDVFDEQGRPLTSFGERRFDDPQLNWCKIAVGPAGEVYLGFEHMPWVRRYGAEGRVMSEFRFDHPMGNIQEDINEKKAAKRGQGPSSAAVIISAIVAADDGVYIFHAYPRAEICFFDPKGKLKETYWYEEPSTSFWDMAVSSNDESKKFFLLDMRSGTIAVLGPRLGRQARLAFGALPAESLGAGLRFGL
jgi:hypothetical protein